MKLKRILWSVIVLNCWFITTCSSQTSEANFYKTFSEIDANKIFSFGKLVETNNKMSTKEALKFVYNNDSKKIYCTVEVYDGETEQVKGTIKELYLPDKCFRITKENYIMVGFSSYECSSPNVSINKILNVSVLDRKHNLKDTLIGYKGTDYDYTVDGLVNSSNGKILLISLMSDQKKAILYKIDRSKLIFDKINEAVISGTDTSDLTNVLKSLGWEDTFNSQN